MKMVILTAAVVIAITMTACRWEPQPQIEDKRDTRRIAFSITRPRLYRIEIVFKEEKKEGSTM